MNFIISDPLPCLNLLNEDDDDLRYENPGNKNNLNHTKYWSEKITNKVLNNEKYDNSHVDGTLSIFLNELLGNAYDSIHLAGRSANPIIEIEVKSDKKHIYFSIKDNGKGFRDPSIPIEKLLSTSKNEIVPFGGEGKALKNLEQEMESRGGNLKKDNNHDLGAIVILTFIKS